MSTSPSQTVPSASSSPNDKAQARHSPPPPLPIDLRHVTSQGGLGPASGSVSPGRRLSQGGVYAGGLMSPPKSPGTGSPIPSSPTSVHSSSSAIFERDIEPLSSPHLHLGPHTSAHAAAHSHRIPRSKTTEPIDQSVPTVLDSAAEILVGLSTSPTVIDELQMLNSVAVEAPVTSITSLTSAYGSPTRSIASGKSRSPSPTRASSSQAPVSLLLSIPQSQSPSPPHIDDPESPTAQITTTRESAPPLPVPTPSSTSSVPIPRPPRSPESPPTAANAAKRLSFLSYTDILTSAPTSTLPLASLTSAAGTTAAPGHITGVGVALGSPSASATASPIVSPTSLGGTSTSPHNLSRSPSLRAPTGLPLSNSQRNSVILLMDELNIGGEWEREGFGKGLEERLEEAGLVG